MKDIKITSVQVLPGDSGFLLDSGNTAILYDSGFAFTGEKMVEKIENELKGRELDYIFLSHSHYDHALGAIYAASRWKNAKVVAGSYAAKIFAKPSARALMRELDRAHAASNGVYEYEDLIDDLRVDITVEDNDEITAGDLSFKALWLPGHTRCSYGFYCEDNKLLLGSESLGVYGKGDVVMPSYLVGYELVMNSLKRVMSLDVQHMILPHYGVIHGDECRRYFENSCNQAVSTAERIIVGYKKGMTDRELTDMLRQMYFKGHIKDITPEKAFQVNADILVNLLKKEL